MATRNDDLTVVVCSCDAYSDLIPHFATLKAKFWPDCPFRTVLVTETETASIPGGSIDEVIALGRGFTWCERLVAALERIASPWVLMLCDDYYLEAPVDTNRFLRRLDQAKEHNALNLRLIPNPATGHPWRDGLLAYEKNTAYCVATQAGIWDREFLLSVARGKASIWEFERYGSFGFGGADDGRMLLCTPEREFPFIDAVHKGCWEPHAMPVLRANGLEPDFSKRTLPPLRARIVEGFKRLVFAVFPWDWIVKIQNRFGLGMKERKRG